MKGGRRPCRVELTEPAHGLTGGRDLHGHAALLELLDRAGVGARCPHVAKVGDRFAALQPVYDAVIDRWGHLDADVARGLELRHDWGPQYRSAHFTGSLAWLGISDDPGVPR